MSHHRNEQSDERNVKPLQFAQLIPRFHPPCCLKEIGRVRKDMYNDTLNGGMFNGRDMEELPEAVGPVAQLQEKLYVPVKEYPDVS